MVTPKTSQTSYHTQKSRGISAGGSLTDSVVLLQLDAPTFARPPFSDSGFPNHSKPHPTEAV